MEKIKTALKEIQGRITQIGVNIEGGALVNLDASALEKRLAKLEGAFEAMCEVHDDRLSGLESKKLDGLWVRGVILSLDKHVARLDKLESEAKSIKCGMGLNFDRIKELRASDSGPKVDIHAMLTRVECQGDVLSQHVTRLAEHRAKIKELERGRIIEAAKVSGNAIPMETQIPIEMAGQLRNVDSEGNIWPAWIDLSNKVPEKDGWYFAGNLNWVNELWWDVESAGFYKESGSIGLVVAFPATHWMSLPPGPK